VNTDAPWPDRDSAWWRVLGIQTKLHQWATDDSDRRFDDLYNLVCDPAFLVHAWERVRGNRGARTAGVDGQTAFYVTKVRGVEGFLDDLRADLKARRFQPLPGSSAELRRRVCVRACSPRKHAVRASGPSRSSSDACSEARGLEPSLIRGKSPVPYLSGVTRIVVRGPERNRTPYVG
jgi:hypothetical protein